MSLPDIEKIKNKHFLLFFFDILFLILPGLATIFFFQKDIFLSLDWIKLIFLSASLVAPVAFFNTLLLLGVDDKKQNSEDGLFIALSMSLIITGFLFYLLLAAAYFIGYSLEVNIMVLIILEVAGTAISMAHEAKKNKEK